MQKYLTMWENTVNASSEQPEDRLSTLEHALAAVALQQAERDSRRLSTQESFTTIALHAEKLLGQPPAEWRRHPSGAEADGRFTGLAALENEPTRGEAPRESDPPPSGQAQFASSDQGRIVRDPSFITHDGLPPGLARTIAAHAGVVADGGRSGPAPYPGTAIGQEWHDVWSNRIPGRDASHNSIAELAPASSASLHAELQRIGRSYTAFKPDGKFTKALADSLITGDAHHKAEFAGLELEYPFDNSQGSQRDQGLPPPGLVGGGALADADHRRLHTHPRGRFVDKCPGPQGPGRPARSGRPGCASNHARPMADRDGGWKRTTVNSPPPRQATQRAKRRPRRPMRSMPPNRGKTNNRRPGEGSRVSSPPPFPHFP